jgi:hypothetical protein
MEAAAWRYTVCTVVWGYGCILAAAAMVVVVVVVSVVVSVVRAVDYCTHDGS